MNTSTPSGSAGTLTAYPDHPIAALFPMISEGEEYDRIKEDIRVFGQKDDIVLHEDMVLDGRNRQKMLLELGKPPQYRTFIPAVEGDPMEFVLSHNLYRRHLTDGQRAAIATDFEERFAAEAKVRRDKIDAATTQAASTTTGSGYDKPEEHEEGAPGPGDSVVDTSGDYSQVKPKAGTNGSKPSAEVNSGKSRKKAAALMGVSERSVADAKKLKKADPAAFDKVKKGETSLNAAITGKATAGSKAAEEYEAALKKIEEVCGKPLANAIKEGSRLKNRKDVVAYADLPDQKMVDIRHLIEHGWALKKAVHYKAEDLLPTHRIIDGITRAAAEGGKSYSTTIETPEMGCDWEVIFKPVTRKPVDLTKFKVGDVVPTPGKPAPKAAAAPKAKPAPTPKAAPKKKVSAAAKAVKNAGLPAKRKPAKKG